MILFNNTHWWEEEGMFTTGFKMNSHNFILYFSEETPEGGRV